MSDQDKIDGWVTAALAELGSSICEDRVERSVRLLAWALRAMREAEREATPPSDPAPVVGGVCGLGYPLPHSPDGCPPTPDAPPAPAPGEDAVEALAQTIYAVERGLLDDEACKWRARQYLAALAAVPGYGRTGTGDGAGEDDAPVPVDVAHYCGGDWRHSGHTFGPMDALNCGGTR